MQELEEVAGEIVKENYYKLNYINTISHILSGKGLVMQDIEKPKKDFCNEVNDILCLGNRLSSILNNKTQPNIKELIVFSQILNIPIDDMIVLK